MIHKCDKSYCTYHTCSNNSCILTDFGFCYADTYGDRFRFRFMGCLKGCLWLYKITLRNFLRRLL